MDFLTIKTRDEKVIKYPIVDILRMEAQDFFIKNMILDCEDNSEPIYINEDYDIIINILDSIRYGKIIYKPDTNFRLMKEVAKKWCAPAWLTDNIDYDEKDINIDNLKKLFESAININEDNEDVKSFVVFEIETNAIELKKIKSPYLKQKSNGLFSFSSPRHGYVNLIPTGCQEKDALYIPYKEFNTENYYDNSNDVNQKPIKNIEHLLEIINFFNREGIDFFIETYSYSTN